MTVNVTRVPRFAFGDEIHFTLPVTLEDQKMDVKKKVLKFITFIMSDHPMGMCWYMGVYRQLLYTFLWIFLKQPSLSPT